MTGKYYAGIDLGRADDYTVINIMNNLGQTVRNIERSFTSEYEELKNKFTEFEERLATYTDTLHEQMRIIHANMPPPIENPEVMSGPAWEVHNYFKSLNMPRIEAIMTQYNASHPQNPNTIDPQSTIDSLFKSSSIKACPFISIIVIYMEFLVF